MTKPSKKHGDLRQDFPTTLVILNRLWSDFYSIIEDQMWRGLEVSPPNEHPFLTAVQLLCEWSGLNQDVVRALAWRPFTDLGTSDRPRFAPIDGLIDIQDSVRRIEICDRNGRNKELVRELTIKFGDKICGAFRLPNPTTEPHSSRLKGAKKILKDRREFAAELLRKIEKIPSKFSDGEAGTAQHGRIVAAFDFLDRLMDVIPDPPEVATFETIRDFIGLLSVWPGLVNDGALRLSETIFECRLGDNSGHRFSERIRRLVGDIFHHVVVHLHGYKYELRPEPNKPDEVVFREQPPLVFDKGWEIRAESYRASNRPQQQWEAERFDMLATGEPTRKALEAAVSLWTLDVREVAVKEAERIREVWHSMLVKEFDAFYRPFGEDIPTDSITIERRKPVFFVSAKVEKLRHNHKTAFAVSIPGIDDDLAPIPQGMRDTLSLLAKAHGKRVDALTPAKINALTGYLTSHYGDVGKQIADAVDSKARIFDKYWLVAMDD